MLRTRRSLRPGVLAGVLVACSMTAPAGGCGPHEGPSAEPALETRLTLRDDLRREARVFRPGETITFVVTLRNRGDSPRTLSLPTSKTHDVLIEDKDHRRIWRHSAGRMYAQVITEMRLAPGEERAFTATWKQLNSIGQPVRPGDYQAVGLVPAGLPGCRSEAARFTIGPTAEKPPPAKDPSG